MAPSIPSTQAPAPAAAPDQDGRTQALPARALSDGSLRSAFCDLLGRPPFLAERQAWLGRARHELCDATLGGEEFWAHWLDEQLYYFFLIDNFRPENERVLAIPAELAAGAIDPRDAIGRIALSPSFDQRNPGADTFVTVVMEQLVGLTVQSYAQELALGKAIYDGESRTFLGRTGKRQADIIDIALRHKGFAEVFIAREHMRLVGVEPPAAERAAWARRFRADPREYAGVVREWLLSEAWDERARRRRPMTNRLFARCLYVDLLDRLPHVDEARRLRTALDGMSDAAPLRSILARMLIDANADALPQKQALASPREWSAAQFQRLLGREASAAELDAFEAALADPECRPATVLYALLTHPEYQSC